MGLEIIGLAAGYRGKAILEGCSLSVKGSETVVLMGPSGCGKSTLLYCVIGFLAPASGKIMLNGKDLGNLAIEKRNIGYLPQDYGLFPHLTVAENVEYGLMVRGVEKEERRKAADGMLGLVNLDGMRQRKIKELSGGQRQRVALARALAIKPDLILLDEPLSNVDQLTRFEVAGNLREVFSKIKIPKIVVTHTPSDAFMLADRLAIMMDGKIVQQGKPNDVLKHPKSELVGKLLAPVDIGRMRK